MGFKTTNEVRTSRLYYSVPCFQKDNKFGLRATDGSFSRFLLLLLLLLSLSYHIRTCFIYRYKLSVNTPVFRCLKS